MMMDAATFLERWDPTGEKFDAWLGKLRADLDAGRYATPTAKEQQALLESEAHCAADPRDAELEAAHWNLANGLELTPRDLNRLLVLASEALGKVEPPQGCGTQGAGSRHYGGARAED